VREAGILPDFTSRSIGKKDGSKRLFDTCEISAGRTHYTSTEYISLGKLLSWVDSKREREIGAIAEFSLKRIKFRYETNSLLIEGQLGSVSSYSYCFGQ
jgi:hypothetical protein